MGNVNHSQPLVGKIVKLTLIDSRWELQGAIRGHKSELNFFKSNFTINYNRPGSNTTNSKKF
jgi:hypothetical protein